MSEPTEFIWVVSYPKSGNTWVRLLLREYFKATTGDPPWETSDNSLYWYQVVSPRPLSTLEAEQTGQLRPAAMMHLTTIYAHRLHRRPYAVVKSHMLSGAYHGIPFFCPLWVDYAIYVYRDPRDVLPSLADHMGVSLEEAAEAMGKKGATIGSLPKIPTLMGTWSEHTLSWLSNRDNARVPMVATSYERLHADTEGELARLLTFCGIDPDPDAVAQAVEACQFDRLRSGEEEKEFVEKSCHQEHFFRRGQIGSHVDEVPEELVAKIEKDHWKAMYMLGYNDE